MMTYEGVLLNVKRLEPSGTWTTPTLLVTLLDDDGEPLVLVATEDAYAVCEQTERLARVRVAVGLRTYKTPERGRVFKLRALRADVLDG